MQWARGPIGKNMTRILSKAAMMTISMCVFLRAFDRIFFEGGLSRLCDCLAESASRLCRRSHMPSDWQRDSFAAHLPISLSLITNRCQ